MAHLDVYPNPDLGSSELIPYVVDMQANLLSDLPSAVVIPLVAPETIEHLPILRLNPRLMVEGRSLVALTQDIASVPRRLLKHPVMNLSQERDALLAALDLLFTGF
jgi:toxin CcdB